MRRTGRSHGNQPPVLLVKWYAGVEHPEVPAAAVAALKAAGLFDLLPARPTFRLLEQGVNAGLGFTRPTPARTHDSR
jgi:hypothetical protein